MNHWLVLRLFSLRDCSELFSIFSVPVLHFPMTLDVLQKSQKTIWIPVQQRVQAGWFSCPLLSRDVSSSPKSHAITWESPCVWARALPGVTRQSLALFCDCYNSMLCHGTERDACHPAPTTPAAFHLPHSGIRNTRFPEGSGLSYTGSKCDQLRLLGMSIGWDLQSWIYW